jgi:L-seryl-tRNA(Ser) seleniumtransferase
VVKVSDIKKLLSSLPSVDEILKSTHGIQWQKKFPRRYILQSVRDVIDDYRKAMLADKNKDISYDVLSEEIQKKLEKLSDYSLKNVINATGIVVHTNLGRSILSETVMQHVKDIAAGYSNLEYDIDKGLRGKRYSHIQRLTSEITGAENCLIVNNNAAAVLVCLNTLAKDKEVIVSRGELVEIGGSFRIPDIMKSSGAILKEAGTTNKTHIHDYENAITENTALLLKVHQSNFRMTGFTQFPSPEKLVSIGRRFSLPVMFDLGSGSLIDLKPYGIHIEPAVQDVIKAGVDIVTFSGDKLLGGPQGGIIAGKSELIEKIAKNPLMRAVRVDKMTLAAYEATIKIYVDIDKAKTQIPTLRMLLEEKETIRRRAQKALSRLKRNSKSPINEVADVSIVSDFSKSGGGALPEVEFATYAVAVKPYKIPADAFVKKLRHNSHPIIARIQQDRVMFDMRTVQDSEIQHLIEGILNALQELA